MDSVVRTETVLEVAEASVGMMIEDSPAGAVAEVASGADEGAHREAASGTGRPDSETSREARLPGTDPGKDATPMDPDIQVIGSPDVSFKISFWLSKHIWIHDHKFANLFTAGPDIGGYSNGGGSFRDSGFSSREYSDRGDR